MRSNSFIFVIGVSLVYLSTMMAVYFLPTMKEFVTIPREFLFLGYAVFTSLGMFIGHNT